MTRGKTPSFFKRKGFSPWTPFPEGNRLAPSAPRREGRAARVRCISMEAASSRRALCAAGCGILKRLSWEGARAARFCCVSMKATPSRRALCAAGRGILKRLSWEGARGARFCCVSMKATPFRRALCAAGRGTPKRLSWEGARAARFRCISMEAAPSRRALCAAGRGTPKRLSLEGARGNLSFSRKKGPLAKSPFPLLTTSRPASPRPAGKRGRVRRRAWWGRTRRAGFRSGCGNRCRYS